jgi:hypothetical protein
MNPVFDWRGRSNCVERAAFFWAWVEKFWIDVSGLDMEWIYWRIKILLANRIARDGLPADTKINQLPEFGGAAEGTEAPVESIPDLSAEENEFLSHLSSARNGYNAYFQYRMQEERPEGESQQERVSAIGRDWRQMGCERQGAWSRGAQSVRESRVGHFDGQSAPRRSSRRGH